MKLTLMVSFCCVMLLGSQFSSSATVVAEDTLEGAQTTSQEKAALITASDNLQQSSEAMKESKEVRVYEQVVFDKEETGLTTPKFSTKARLVRFLLAKFHVRYFLRHYRQSVTDDVVKRNRSMNYLRMITVLGLSIIYFFVINSQL